MANLKTNIKQAIADFNAIETAIEECGVDVPYDTDTSEYGNLVRQVYAQASTGVKSVFNADTHYDFPSIGDAEVIYKAQSEKLLYQWNTKAFKYEVLGGTGEVDFDSVEIINGGNANGTN